MLQMCTREEGYAALEGIKQKLLDRNVSEEAAEQSLSTEVDNHSPCLFLHALLSDSTAHCLQACECEYLVKTADNCKDFRCTVPHILGNVVSQAVDSFCRR